MNNEGKIWFGVGLDNDELRADAQQSVQIFKNIGKSAGVEGARIERDMLDVQKTAQKASKIIGESLLSGTEDLSKNIKIQRDVIKDLERQYKQAETAVNKAAPGSARTKLAEELKAVRKELDAEKESLNHLVDAQERYRQGATSLRTQLMNIRNDMGRLALQGKENTAEYRRLESDLQRLGTIYRKLQAEQLALSTGGTQWAGIISGIQGVAGAFAAGQGAAGLFVKDNEKLAQIQTKLQAILAVTIGLQQVSNTLHETSAFRITTIRKVTELWTIATTRLSAALGISNAAAKVLMGTLTLGLSVAISAIIYGINKWNEKQEELKKKQKEAKAELDKYNQSIADTAAITLTTFRTLQAQWNSLNGDIKKQTSFIKEHKGEFEKLGVAIHDINDADNLFVRNEQAFVDSVMARAKAAAAMELATEKYKTVLLKLIKAEAVPANNSRIGTTADRANRLPEKENEYQNTLNSIREQEIARIRREGEQEIKKLIDINVKATAEFDKILADAGIKTFTKGANKIIKAQSDLASILLAYQLKLQEDNIKLMRDGKVKRLAEIDLEYNQIIAEIAKARQKLEATPDGKVNVSETKRIASEMEAIGKKMVTMFGTGNVDLLARPMIDAAELVKKGWEDAGEGIATVFSSQFGIETPEGKEMEILVTPILPDGTVLSPSELEQYVFEDLSGANDILKADTKGIVLSVNVDPDGSAGEALHQLQGQYYDLKQKAANIKPIKGMDVLEQRLQVAEQKRLHDRQQAEKEYTLQTADAYRQLADVFLSEEERKTQAIEKTYQDMRNKAVEDMMAGNFNASEFVTLNVQIDNAEERDKLKEQTDKYRRYAEERLRIEQDFQDEVKRLRERNPNGGSELEIEQRRGIKDSDISALATQMDIKEGEFTQFVDSVINRGIEELLRMITEAQAALDALGEDGDPAKKAELTTRIKVAKIQLENQQKVTSQTANSDPAKKWKDTLAVMNDVKGITSDVISNFDDLDDATQAVLNAAMNIATGVTNMIIGITTLAIGSATATTTTATVASTAIQGVEKAAVILAVISAALQVAQAIASLFVKDHELSEQTIQSYEAYMDVTDELINQQKELMKVLTGVQALMASDEGVKAIKKQEEAARNLGKAYLASRAKNNHSYGVKTEKRLRGYIDEIKRAGFDWEDLRGYGRMEGLFDLSAEDLQRFKKELPEVWAQLDDDTRKYLDTILECKDKMDELGQSTSEALTGFTLDDARSELLDFLNDIEGTFDDVAENFEKTMMNSISRVIASGLDEDLKKWYDDFAERMEDGNLSDNDREALKREYERIYKEAIQKRNAAYEAAGIDPTDQDNREASKKGIATASQDSVDENNGRLTVIQGHTYNILETLKLTLPPLTATAEHTAGIRAGMDVLRANSGEILEHLAGIRDNTAYCRRLEPIEGDIRGMKTTLDSINTKGLTIRK